MSNITQDEIKKEFRRQVSLCSGIGKQEMLKALDDYFRDRCDACSLPLANDGGCLSCEEARRRLKR